MKNFILPKTVRIYWISVFVVFLTIALNLEDFREKLTFTKHITLCMILGVSLGIISCTLFYKTTVKKTMSLEEDLNIRKKIKITNNLIAVFCGLIMTAYGIYYNIELAVLFLESYILTLAILLSIFSKTLRKEKIT